MIKNLKIALILFTVFYGCKNQDVQPVEPIDDASGKYVVINEGLYGQNNSSVTVYDYQRREATQFVYSNANGGASLGDTANDFAQCCGKGFIVLDKSKKVEIVDLRNFTSLGFIDFTEYGSPRRIVLYDSLRAYISTLNGKVVVINPENSSVQNVIDVGEYPEGLAICNEKLFVANSGFGIGNTVSVIDLASSEVIKEIVVRTNPRFIEASGNFVYVISSGEYAPPGEGAVTKIDAISLAAVYTVKLNGNPGKAEIAGENLYVIYSEGVAKISLNDFTIVDSLFIAGSNVNSLTGFIYSIYFDREHSRLLLGNPKDFTQSGETVIFDLNGNKIGKFECGINPGTISLIN